MRQAIAILDDIARFEQFFNSVDPIYWKKKKSEMQEEYADVMALLFRELNELSKPTVLS